MECWRLTKRKTRSLIFMMLLMFMVPRINGVCIEEERKALLEIKASFKKSFHSYDVDNLLPTWVDRASTTGSECCDWERVKCHATTGHVTDLFLSDMQTLNPRYIGLSSNERTWSLNVSHFLHFKELKSLDLSYNFLDNTIVSTGLERLSILKKLEILNLANSRIDNHIFPSLGGLTSLKILNLSLINGMDGFSPAQDISEFPALENLEALDLNHCGCYGSFQMQGSESVSILKKVKILNLRFNQFNESLLTSLSSFHSLKVLNLYGNNLHDPFPAQGLAHMTNLEKLDLSVTWYQGTPNIQGCESLLRLKRLKSISLTNDNFNTSIISCLSFLPSLKNLDLSYSSSAGPFFTIQELSSLRELETLDLSYCSLLSLSTLNGTMSNLVHLNLDGNVFIEDVMRSMSAFPSLRVLSLESSSFVPGIQFGKEVPNLPNMEVLILRDNLFNGTLPIEALASFRHLEVLDLSGNNFVGNIPSTIKSFSSLRALSVANNALNGSLWTDHGLCQLKNLQELDLSRNMFDGNLPECFNRLSYLKLLDISSNKFTGILPPSLIPNLTFLEYVDFSHNKFGGSLSFSLFSNHTKLEIVEFISDNDNFVVETEEPIGWIPMFQLKVLVLSNCNLNRPKGSVIPSFLLQQHKLRVIGLSHNSLEGQFPNWLIKNNSMLLIVNLRNNSFGGIISMPLYRYGNTESIDLSGNHITGTILGNIRMFPPKINYLNLSNNALSGAIPSSIGDLSDLSTLDLSNNEFSGEVPEGLFTNVSSLYTLKLSNNRLHGQVLSGNSSLGVIDYLHLDSNYFTGEIGIKTTKSNGSLYLLDISNNFFTGMIPGWMSNIRYNGEFPSMLSELVVKNNRLEGQFPCGAASFSFLDISENYFSGPIPSCLNLNYMKHLHLGSNRFNGSIPSSFHNLTDVLTLDISNNSLSGTIPGFLGELNNLRILLLGKNNFIGSIPKKLCQLNNASLIDLSSNSLSGSIPPCLNNITGPGDLAFIGGTRTEYATDPSNVYGSVRSSYTLNADFQVTETRDEARFTTKSISLTYKGNILDYMSGFDLSCNKLTGEIPVELGLLSQIYALNLSHNQLTGPIPVNFSNLSNIESLDLSSNSLSGGVPSQLIELKSIAVFNVSNNNLSGRLPEMKAQFGTFTKESYEGNPLLCGPPLEKKCTPATQVTDPSADHEGYEKWYDVDMVWFFGSFGSTTVMFLLGFAAVLYTNPYWRRRWLDLVEEFMYTCYYFLHDIVRKSSTLFCK